MHESLRRGTRGQGGSAILLGEITCKLGKGVNIFTGPSHVISNWIWAVAEILAAFHAYQGTSAGPATRSGDYCRIQGIVLSRATVVKFYPPTTRHLFLRMSRDFQS